MLISGHFEHYLDAILTSRKPHSCCFSTNSTYLRGKYKRYRSSFNTKYWVMLSLLAHQRLSDSSLCRFLWVFVSGLKTTSLLRLVNRRLNMPTSECAPVSPSLYQCQIYMPKNNFPLCYPIHACEKCCLWSRRSFYRFVKKKFEELYFQSSMPDRVDRVFKIYRTTALDQKLVKKTFKLIDESMRRSREGTWQSVLL